MKARFLQNKNNVTPQKKWHLMTMTMTKGMNHLNTEVDCKAHNLLNHTQTFDWGTKKVDRCVGMWGFLRIFAVV